MNPHVTSFSRLFFSTVCASLTLGALTAEGGVNPRGKFDRASAAERVPANVRLAHIEQGEQAIIALGEQNLGAVANAYDLDAPRLKKMFRGDHRLRVDKRGRLFYAEEPVPAGAPVPPVPPAGLDTPTPSNAFLLNSKPGAKRVIYLDFDGHVLSGNAWSDSNNGGAAINAPAWDIDGNPAVFSDAERGVIVAIWQRVAEDFAPFDVNVTTEYPGEAAIDRSGSSDEYYGTRALVSPISSYFGAYGGIAYVGVFNMYGSYYKPALVFPERLSNSEKYIAEAISHEVGHNLGLSHDGTASVGYYQGHGNGTCGWAPIMGVGYYKNVSQWSRGEYTGANNLQDDLSIIQSYGLPYRADDHGNTAAAATMLPAGSSIYATGIIERSTDVDAFGFVSSAGPLTVTIQSCERGPNLDASLRLVNASGAVLASANPGDVLTATLTTTVTAGTYYVLVSPVGNRSPATDGYSVYGSLGEYTLTGNITTGVALIAPVAVAGATPTSCAVGQAIHFTSAQSYDVDGTITGYSWNFGDGTTSTLADPAKTYAAAGNYAATLTVTDNNGLTHSSTVGVTVSAQNVPPVARISTSATSGTAPVMIAFYGSGSSDADGSVVSYFWSFSDGTTSYSSSLTKTFNAVGVYTAMLTVTDNQGATHNTSVTINVTAANNVLPVARITPSATSGTAPAAISFSGTTSSDADGSIVSYAWSFSDGTNATGSTVNKTFTTAGVHTATLTVTDDRGGMHSSTTSVTIVAGNILPVARISASATSGTAPVMIAFYGTGSSDADGTILSYLWSFSDGTTSYSSSLTKTFTTAGVHTATLTVTDNQGGTHSTSVTLTIGSGQNNVLPVARITPSATSGTAPAAISFSGATSSDADGSIVGYAWSFSDGTSATGSAVSKTFTTAGVHTATLTVTDNRGGTHSTSTQVQINEATAPTMRVDTMSISVSRSRTSGTATVTVRVTDLSGNPVSGATVSGNWSGVLSGSSSGKTDSSGSVKLTSKSTRNRGALTFSVAGITKQGTVYVSASNQVNSVTVDMADGIGR